MRNKQILVLFTGIALLLASCTSQPLTQKTDARTSAKQKIDSLQTILKSGIGGSAQNQAALQLAEAYQYYALDFKDDTITLEYILREANIYANFGDYMKAAKLCKYGYDTYPSHKLRPNALFFLGNNLHDAKDSAQCITVFKEFVRVYPTHPYRPSADQMIAFVMKGDHALEDFIERRAKEVADSLAKAKLQNQ